MTAAIAGIKACVFDAYGTLFDYASAAAKCRDVIGDKELTALTTLWRDKQLQYTWLRSLQSRHADFWQVTGDALDYALETLGIADAALHARLMNLYLTLDAFPDVADTLLRLKAAGLRAAILSNGTRDMLREAVDGAGLAMLLDAVLSVEEVGVFKTSPLVYCLALDRLGLAAGEVCFVSSNGWDAHAASDFGMRVVWCNRYGQRAERLPGKPDHVIATLADLPSLVGA
ncbi:MAG: haloacid dehalogenase type II [Stellaceae bacterium]